MILLESPRIASSPLGVSTCFVLYLVIVARCCESPRLLISPAATSGPVAKISPKLTRVSKKKPVEDSSANDFIKYSVIASVLCLLLA